MDTEINRDSEYNNPNTHQLSTSIPSNEPFPASSGVWALSIVVLARGEERLVGEFAGRSTTGLDKEEPPIAIRAWSLFAFGDGLKVPHFGQMYSVG